MAKLIKVPAAKGGGKQEYYPATVGIVTKHDGTAGGFKTTASGVRTNDGGASLEKMPRTPINIGSETTTKRKRK